MGLPIPVPTVAAIRPTATTQPTAIDVIRADRASFMNVATSNANMSSGAMVMGAIADTTVIIRTEATAVTTVILRTEVIAVTTVMRPTGVIDPGQGPGATAMATAVSGAAGHRRTSADTNGPDTRNSHDRQRRFCMRGTTKPFLVTESGMPATRSNIAGTATSEGAADVSQRPAAPTLGDVASGPFGSLNLRTPCPQA